MEVVVIARNYTDLGHKWYNRIENEQLRLGCLLTQHVVVANNDEYIKVLNLPPHTHLTSAIFGILQPGDTFIVPCCVYKVVEIHIIASNLIFVIVDISVQIEETEWIGPPLSTAEKTTSTAMIKQWHNSQSRLSA